MDPHPSKEEPLPPIGPKRPSFDGQGTLGTDSDADSSSSNMDGVGDGYRRRRAQLIAGLENGHARSKERGKQPQPQNRNTSGTPDEEGKHMAYSSDDGSEFSSTSTGDEFELGRLPEEEVFTDDEETGLTRKTKEYRRRKRRKATRLDERIAGSVKTSKQEQKVADWNVLKAMIINVLLIASWYLFSLSISIYNKWMFTEKYLDFKFPLFVTCLHMLVQFCLATLVLYCIPRLRPRSDSITNPQNHYHVRRNATQDDKPLMTSMFYFTRIGPCGAATGLDIGLGNMSLKFISLTFYTMCKSSSLAFVLMFAFLFRLESPSIKLVLIIATMTVGVIMMVAGEAAFDAIGFILVIAAAFFSGFRWALTQILLLRNPATSNPFSSIFFLAPIMFLVLILIALPIEGPLKLGEGLATLAEAKGVFTTFCILIFPGTLAFLMTASEFALLQRTSVVTLSICGIFKEVVTILTAGIVFHDPLTPINVSGLIVTIISITAYNYVKITKMRKDARDGVQGSQKLGELDESSEAAAPMLSPRGSVRAGSSLDVPNERPRASSTIAASKTPHENE